MATETYGTEPHRIHRRGAHDTSVEAAHTTDTKVGEGAVHAAIRSAGSQGMTGYEVAEHLRRNYHTISGRFIALQQKGLIRDSGQRRKTPRGVNAIVWVEGDGVPLPPKVTRAELLSLLREARQHALPVWLYREISDALSRA